MSMAEEEILTNVAYLKSGAAFRMLFDACMASDYDAGKLLSYDSTYLLYALRNIGYGSDYTFKVKCEECQKEFTHTIDVAEITFDELPEDTKEIYDIELPYSKYTVTMNLPRIKQDENVIKINENNTMQKQIKQINKEPKIGRNKTIITGVAGGLIAGAITILYITK